MERIQRDRTQVMIMEIVRSPSYGYGVAAAADVPIYLQHSMGVRRRWEMMMWKIGTRAHNVRDTL
jgi:hypothetical protein